MKGNWISTASLMAEVSSVTENTWDMICQAERLKVKDNEESSTGIVDDLSPVIHLNCLIFYRFLLLNIVSIRKVFLSGWKLYIPVQSIMSQNISPDPVEPAVKIIHRDFQALS